MMWTAKTVVLRRHPRRVTLHHLSLEVQPVGRRLCCTAGTTTVVVRRRRQAGKVTRRPEHVELAGAAVLPPPALHHHELPDDVLDEDGGIMHCGGQAVGYVDVLVELDQ